MIARSKQAVRAVAGMYLGLPRSESPESGPCSRFLPCKITRPGLPIPSGWRLAVCDQAAWAIRTARSPRKPESRLGRQCRHDPPQCGAAPVSVPQFGLPLDEPDPRADPPRPRAPARATPARPIHVSAFERAGEDFYATPAWVTEALLRHIHFRGPIWEPCCGDGAMSTVLGRHGYTVVSTDIAARGFGIPGIDFLACRTVPEGCRSIVTNPPYGELRLACGTVAVIHGDAEFSAPCTDAHRLRAGPTGAAGAAAVDRWSAGRRGDVSRSICRRRRADTANPLVRAGRRYQAGATSPRLGGLRPCPPVRAAAGDVVCRRGVAARTHSPAGANYRRFRRMLGQTNRPAGRMAAGIIHLGAITYSVFRLAARRTKRGAQPPKPEAAPVSEKRVGLNRSPRPGYGR